MGLLCCFAFSLLLLFLSSYLGLYVLKPVWIPFILLFPTSESVSLNYFPFLIWEGFQAEPLNSSCFSKSIPLSFTNNPISGLCPFPRTNF